MSSGRFALAASCIALSAVTNVTSADARPCPVFGEYPCADQTKCIEDLKASAPWVIEGKIVGIEKTGEQTECDEGIGRRALCSQIDRPEKIKLSELKVLRGNYQPIEDDQTIVQKDVCFSGPIASIMNDRPELSMVGRRVIFYGSNRDKPPFVTGFYYVEIAR
jgi:hypothetical protein